VQYLAPIGDGITFKAGKFATPIGVEVLGSVYNWNITRGNVWNLLEPIDHIGVQAAYTFGDTGFDAMIGGVNGFNPESPDTNSGKSLIGHVGWANDKLSIGVNGLWGPESQAPGNTVVNNALNNHNTVSVVNGLIKYTASDRLAFYVNGDYDFLNTSDNIKAWGVSVAGRFGITDRTGIALRGEYVTDNGRALGFCGFSDSASSTQSCGTLAYTNPNALNLLTGVNIWGVTGTIDHLLTDNLMVRLEGRWDVINKDSANDGEFFKGSADPGETTLGLQHDQITVGAEVIYNFTKFGGK
jgi:hypothetical protein